MTIKPDEIVSKPKLIGAIRPRLENVPLEGTTRAPEIFELAESIEMPLMPWQKYVLEDMMSISDEDGSWRRRSNLLLVARQQGKTHLASMRIIWGLLQGERIIAMSSNRGMALDTFRNVTYIIERWDHLRVHLAHKPRMANGSEMITFKNGGRYEIVAATRDGSRGRTADLLFIDELREISEEGFKAATPLTRATGGQSFFVSNAGDAFSIVLNNLRERALSYPPETLGFYEYSANQFAKIDDRKEWALANPALGWTVTEETLEEAVATSSIETTKTEMLCIWIDSLQSPWPHGVLEETSDSSVRISPEMPTIMAFDVAPSRRHASLVAGQILEDGRIAVGILQKWESQVAVDDLKIAAEIKAWTDKYRPRMVCYDKYATESIAHRLGLSGVMVQDVSGQAFYQACGDLLDGLVNHRVTHAGQDDWIGQMNNVAAKTNDSAWRIVKRKSAGPIDAAIGSAMVVHQLMKPQSTPTIMSG